MASGQSFQHYDRDEVQSILATALAVVEELELDDELRVAAFQAAVNLLSAKTIERMAPTGLLLGQPRPRG